MIQNVPVIPDGHRARCRRCTASLRRSSPRRSNERAAAWSLAALLLYPAAILLPIMQIERMGHAHEATVWSGMIELFAEGEPVIAAIVFICSIIAPLGKLIVMFSLCAGDAILKRNHRARAYLMVEWLGRWGMLDVLLVALLVAIVKLGSWVEIKPGPGAIAFAGVVVLSMLASTSFDPKAIWSRTPGGAR